MFVLRGITVSLEVFFLVYACLSGLIAACSPMLLARPRFSPANSATLLFSLRTLPLFAALTITTCLTVPSFLRFEPRGADEPIGVLAILLSCATLASISTGITRAVLAWQRTSRQVAAWVNSSEHVGHFGIVPIFSLRSNAPAFAVSGLRSPKLLISSEAAAKFTNQEMHVAITHELAHIRRGDNFKKLLLRLCTFPGMAKLERAWSEAAEIAADDAAVSNEREALDLASALIKASQLTPTFRAPELAMSLVPDSTVIAQRVQRLLEWKQPVRSRRASYKSVLAGMLGAALLPVIYAPALTGMHAITELLIR